VPYEIICSKRGKPSRQKDPKMNPMKLAIILGVPAIVGAIFIMTACRKRGPEAEATAAVGRGDFQFIAVLDPEGKWTRPQFSDIPAWYFETTGVRVQTTKPETKDTDLAYMKSYNDALYKALKEQGKFHVIEENIARVRKNLDGYEQSKKSK
jgi:hypothetical protein